MTSRSTSRFARTLLAFFAVAALSGSALADSITGVVTNKTNNKPAAGDDVVLIRLSQGMQESTRTKTDSRGHFSLDVPDPGGMHLVRVTHDKANYFQPVQPGTNSLQVDVYTAAAKVEGVSGEADVLKIQSEPGGANLSVIEMFFVKNESNPPKTQFSDRPFDFYLPDGAVVEGSVALSPGGMPVRSAPVPLGDQPNHYAFIFPLRPGESRFQVTYKLPYKGSFNFTPHPGLPTDTVAIVMPKSMKFQAPQTSPYQRVTEETSAQAYAARNVSPSEPLGFTVSGIGELPRDSDAAPAPNADSSGQGADANGGSAAADNRPGGGLGKPIDPEGANDPWAKYKWWILGGLGLFLAAGAGVMLKQPVPAVAGAAPATPASPATAAASSPVAPPAAAGGGVLATLRDELFALETDRLQGRLSEAEYLDQKAALEVVLRRALARSQASGSA
ncbi:MAG TPA: hypothetical protein VNW54_12065 [Granulicella sp.]|jgi:hypothetical protein|nr:hypothetical protein [Granulicella sp.]